ncbi:MAG: hypothetical protein ACK5JB_00085, partial [Pseudanabaena sp.]
IKETSTAMIIYKQMVFVQIVIISTYLKPKPYFCSARLGGGTKLSVFSLLMSSYLYRFLGNGRDAIFDLMDAVGNFSD